MAEIELRDGSSLVLVAQNNDTLKVLRPRRKYSSMIRLKNDDMSAELVFDNRKKEYREFSYGSGYLGQSSRVCAVPGNVSSVTITNYLGKRRKVDLREISK